MQKWAELGWDEDLPILVIDFETTGFSSEAKIVEVGLVLLDNDMEVSSTFRSLIDPGIPIPQEATNVHGISDGDVRGAPGIDEFFVTSMLPLMEATGWASHGLPFDLRMLRQSLSDELLRVWPSKQPTVCTLSLLRSLFPQWKKHRLLDAANAFNVSYEPSEIHSALTDARILGTVLSSLVRSGTRLPVTKLSGAWLG
jgi:DNA polymerase III epsilon subunit-like protein